MNHSLCLPRRPLLGSIAALLLCSAAPIFAQEGPVDATWLPSPSTSDWNTSSNWTGNNVPTGTASFATSTTTTVTVSAESAVNTIQFNSGASAFTISFVPSEASPVLVFTGSGVTNSSSATQNFVSATNSSGNSSGFVFTGSATAGSNTIFTNMGATVNGAPGGFTQFQDTSNAGSATLIANGGSNGGGGGEILFFDQASGGTARVVLNGSGSSAGTLDISNVSNPSNGNSVTVGSIEGSGNVYLGANNLTVGGNNMNTVFSGVIQDGGVYGGVGGSLTKIGTGALDLTGVNTYTGNTVVNAGTLLVDGSIASPLTTVNAAGTLAGAGLIGGSVINNGIVLPGSLAGATLTVKGDYTQSSTGTLVIGVANPGSHTTLAVAGAATLGGTLQVVSPQLFKFTDPGQEFTFLTAKSVSGTFSNVQGLASLNGSPSLSTQVIYLPGAVELEAVKASSLAGEIQGLSGITSGDLQTAQLIDLDASNPAVANLINFLHGLTPSQLANDIKLIDPTSISALSNVNSSLSTQTINSLTSRFVAIQSAGGPGGPAGPDGKGGKEIMPAPADRWGAFITGSGEFEHVDDTPGARGFNMAAGGFTLGVDYRFTDHLVVGILGGYTNTGIDISNGKVNVNAGKGGLYGTWFDGGFYVNSALEGGYSSYDNHRDALAGIARGSTDGGDFSALFAPGYNWTMGGLTFGPTTRFQYTYESTGGFTESGSLAPMTIGSQHTESIVSAVGIKASYDWKIGTTIIRPELRLEWEHEYGDTDTTIAAGLAAAPGHAVSLASPTIGRDDLHLGAGLAVVFNERFTAYAYYDGQFFRTNYDASTVTGGLRVSF